MTRSCCRRQPSHAADDETRHRDGPGEQHPNDHRRFTLTSSPAATCTAPSPLMRPSLVTPAESRAPAFFN